VICRSACEPHRRRGWPAAVAAATAALLAACSQGTVATQSYSYRQDVPGYEQNAASIGPTLVTVYNSPYPTADVIAAMQGRNPGPKLTFTATPDAKATYRIVLVFGESHQAPSTYCEAPAVSSSPSPTGRLTITAAFCSQQIILSDAVARTTAIASTQDPEFGRTMSDLLSALLPQYSAPGTSGDGQMGGGM
jgi:hypothetical protein